MKVAAAVCMLFAAFATSAKPEKQIIVSYPSNTAADVLESAKDAIREAGGIITHEYSLIKGFAAKTTEDIVDKISALGAEHDVLVEEDQVISVAGSS